LAVDRPARHVSFPIVMGVETLGGEQHGMLTPKLTSLSLSDHEENQEIVGRLSRTSLYPRQIMKHASEYFDLAE
jgi:hypothetical protein